MTAMSRFSIPKALAGFLTGLAVFALLTGIRSTGLLQALELGAYDSFLSLSSGSSAYEAPVTLVTISETDIQYLGSWPITDKDLAALLRSILQAGPRVVGLDIYRDIPVPPGRQELSALFGEGHTIVTVSKAGDGGSKGVAAPYMLRDKSAAGFNDLPVDRDGVIRRGLLFMEDESQVLTSFGLLLALSYLRFDSIGALPDPANPAQVRIGRAVFPPFRPNDGGYVRADAGGYQMLLDFGSKPFQRLPVADLLSGRADPASLRDRVVIIGSVAESMKDVFATPVAGAFSGARLMHGVEIHAHTAGQIIKAALSGKGLIRPVSEQIELVLILIASVSGGFLGSAGRSLWSFGAAFAAGLALITAGAYLAFRAGYWVPVVPPAVSWVSSIGIMAAYLSFRERNDRRLLMSIFSRHVSKEVAEVIWQERDRLMADGRLLPEKMTATVLFTDLQDFTVAAEKQGPDELMEWLNIYMDVMSAAVIKHHGMVNKFIGDSVMAVFGAPLGHEDKEAITVSAGNAVRCALAMREDLAVLNRKWENMGRQTVSMRVGIHTGLLVAGSVGGRERMEYTVIGDTVNTASRLEGYLKQLKADADEKAYCRILISEATAKLTGDAFLTEKVGEIQVKGREQTLVVYKVLGGR